jgi:hypothetical protein
LRTHTVSAWQWKKFQPTAGESRIYGEHLNFEFYIISFAKPCMHAWLCSMTLQSHAWLCQAMHGFAWLCKAMREFQSRMAFDGSAAAGLGPACALARLFDADAYFKSSWSRPGPARAHA